MRKTHVTAAQAADMMSVHVETIRRMLADGRLQGERIEPDNPQSPWRVLVSSIESFGAQGVPSSGPADTPEGTEGE